MSEKHVNRSFFDQLGSLVSITCVVHCILVALVPGVLAARGSSSLLGEPLEWAFTLGAVAIGLTAAVQGWRRHHSRPILTGILVGCSLLLVARGAEVGDVDMPSYLIAVLGGMLLVGSHMANMQRQCCTTCCPCCPV